MSLPVVEAEQKYFRKSLRELLRIDNPIDYDYSITLPGFMEWMLEEFSGAYLTETVRHKVSKEEYVRQCASYIGAFVAGNENITYMDETEFKKLYPNLSFYDESGQPRIKSYDVNSMYPDAMFQEVPYGDLEGYPKPKWKKYVEWVEIHFTKYWDEGIKQLYQWKPKYAGLNNSFFGDHFEDGIEPGKHRYNRHYVLRELLDLFYEMCDAHVIEVCSRFQETFPPIRKFVEVLYEIKCNKDNKYSPSTVKLVKLGLNSTYGKLAEKFREHKFVWIGDLLEIAKHNPEYISLMFDVGLLDRKDGRIRIKDKAKETDEFKKLMKTQKFRNKVSPYIDLDRECGFLRAANMDKRFDVSGKECRESILSGAYVTM